MYNKEMPRIILAYNVKRYRKEKHLTQGKLAEKTGLHEITISNIETQKTWPDEVTLSKIAEVLGVKYCELFMEQDYNLLAVKEIESIILEAAKKIQNNQNQILENEHHKIR